MSIRRKLRIGLLQDTAYASQYMRDLVEWAGTQDSLEINHLITYGSPANEPPTLSGRNGQPRPGRFRQAVFNCLRKAEQALLQRYHGGAYRDHTRQFRIDELISQRIQLTPSISASGLAFSLDQVAQIRACECDILIHSGTGRLTGEILEASKLGVLSLRYWSDRGDPDDHVAGFWESYLALPATGFVIYRLASGSNGGHVVQRGAFESKWFFLFNQAELFTKAHFFFKQLLSRIARERAVPRVEELLPESSRQLYCPSIRNCLGYAGTLAGRIVGRAFRIGAYRLLGYQDRWAVSISFAGWRRAVLWQATTPKPPAGRFLADPFVWRHEGKTFCLAEDYLYRERIGRISAFQIDEQGITEPQLVLKEPFHLSFPYLFEFEGTIYMCPECSAARQIRVYRATKFPDQWELVKAIMTDVSAVDTMLFEKGDRWWMLTNLDLPGLGGLRSELYLFSADSPLSESWLPHPANPLKIDPLGGRNAGLLRDGSKLYRAGQVHGFELYGAGIRLYEICSLSLEDYTERLVTEIHPTFRRGLVGTHHISSTGEVTVVDGYRREVVR